MRLQVKHYTTFSKRSGFPEELLCLQAWLDDVCDASLSTKLFTCCSSQKKFASLPIFYAFLSMVFPWFFSKMFFPCNFHFTHIAFLRIHEICSVWSCHIETVWLWDVVFFRTTDQYLELAFCFFPSDFHSANVGFGWWGLGPSGLDALMKGVATQGYPNHQPKPLGDAHCLLLDAMMSCEAECFCCRCCCFWWWGVGWCLTRMAEDGWWGWWQCWRRWWQWS